MPNVKENRFLWERFDWSRAGEEWSEAWGDSDMQWVATLLPRIHAFVPSRAILEIGCGYGRWAARLLPLCERYTGVDLSAPCVESCRERFQSASHAVFHRNDGSSLAMVDDGSIDFVFSFDSLVHAENDAVAGYLAQIASKLTPEGVAFIHHSNLFEHARYLAVLKRIPRSVRHWLMRRGVIDDVESGFRAWDGHADRIREQAERAGLCCVAQERINWCTRRAIDCISTFALPGSRWDRETVAVENHGFMAEAAWARRLAGMYGKSSFVGCSATR